MIIPMKPNRVARTYLGGHRIDRLRGGEGPDGFFPEEWIASVVAARNPGGDGAEGLSTAKSGETLPQLLAGQPELLGGCEGFPILLKLLDASERLVIQAHPTAEFAAENLASPYGKAECWYVLDADPGAHVYLGFREGVTREAWVSAFEAQDSGKMLSMLHRIDLQVGDVWYVDGGVPHAIGGGCLLAELQEPSDLMVVPEGYTPGGRKITEARMHCGLGFERMFDVFDYTGYSRAALEAKYFRHPTAEPNLRCPVIDTTLTTKFRMDEYRVEGSCRIPASDLPGAAVVLEGEGCISEGDAQYPMHPGDSFFLSAGTVARQVSGNVRILIAIP